MVNRATALTLFAGIFVLAAACQAQDAQQDTRPLTYDLALTAMDAAEAEAWANDWNVTIVVADHEGVPVFVRRHDGASPRTFEIAMQKVNTVIASGGLTSAEYGQQVEDGEREQIPNTVTFAGGVPIVRDGELIGAVAASGVRAVQDEQISFAGTSAVAP